MMSRISRPGHGALVPIVTLILFLSWFCKLTVGNCGDTCGRATRFRACPFNPPGLEVTRGIGGHCPVGEPVIGECVADEDCFLKRKGNVCCYNRCRGMTECHQFP